MVRNSLKYVSWKDYKAVTGGLKTVYQAPTEEAELDCAPASVAYPYDENSVSTDSKSGVRACGSRRPLACEAPEKAS
ncbi:hypothetical protein ASE99_24055 [Serratia sp. Leaf51]|nr:hypothetical protein ASE99_24055 [Serratia sp. Leaf51]